MPNDPAQERPPHADDDFRRDIWPADTYPMFPVHEKGDDLKVPSANDPWSTMYHDNWEHIKQQSNGWKEEIQALLTFTGLFSAVVGGFVVSTYKDLSLDPGNANNFLLAQIALRLDASIGITNATSIPPLSLSPSFSPPRSLVRVHIFWFLSLILALSTAIVGILCLQWIREYERHSPHIRDGRRGFSILAMRMESLKQWHVPAVIAYLPQVLQASLILFFVGMIEFLLPLGKSIAIPTIVIISITLFFLLYTTYAPMAQMVYHLFSRDALLKWYPCAYRSPQAWRAITTSTVLFFIWATLFVKLPVVLVRSIARRVSDIVQGRPSGDILGPVLQTLTELWKTGVQVLISESTGVAGQEWNTLSFDFALDEIGRFREIEEATRQLEGSYALRGLLNFTVVSGNWVNASGVFRCVDTLPESVLRLDVVPAVTRLSPAISAIRDDSDWDLVPTLLLRSWSDPPPELTVTENRLLLIATLHNESHDIRDPDLALHELELYIRLLAGIYGGPTWMKCRPGVLGLLEREAYIPEELKPDSRREKLPKIKNADICIEQLVLIWVSFVKRLFEYNEPIEDGQYHRQNDIWYLSVVVFPALSTYIRSSVEGDSATPSLTDPILHSLQALSKINVMATPLLKTDSPVSVRTAIGTYLATCCGGEASTTNFSLRFRALLAGVPPLWDAPFSHKAQPLNETARMIVEDYVTSLFVLAQTLRQQAPATIEEGRVGVFFVKTWSAAIPHPPTTADLSAVPKIELGRRSSDMASSSSSRPPSLSDAAGSRSNLQDGEVLVVDKLSCSAAADTKLSAEPEASTSPPTTIIPNDSSSLTFPYPTPASVPPNPYDAVIEVVPPGSPARASAGSISSTSPALVDGGHATRRNSRTVAGPSAMDVPPDLGPGSES